MEKIYRRELCNKIYVMKNMEGANKRELRIGIDQQNWYDIKKINNKKIDRKENYGGITWTNIYFNNIEWWNISGKVLGPTNNLEICRKPKKYRETNIFNCNSEWNEEHLHPFIELKMSDLMIYDLWGQGS